MEAETLINSFLQPGETKFGRWPFAARLDKNPLKHLVLLTQAVITLQHLAYIQTLQSLHVQLQIIHKSCHLVFMTLQFLHTVPFKNKWCHFLSSDHYNHVIVYYLMYANYNRMLLNVVYNSYWLSREAKPAVSTMNCTTQQACGDSRKKWQEESFKYKQSTYNQIIQTIYNSIKLERKFVKTNRLIPRLPKKKRKKNKVGIILFDALNATF